MSLTTTGVSVSAIELQYEVEQFLYHEADLLDSWQWSEWLALFTEDISYRMPVRKNRLRRQRAADEAAEATHMALFDDDHAKLALRVKQLNSGRHWAEDPPSRVRHLVTNVRVTPGDDGEYAVRSNFVVYRNRLETEVDIWAGERQDVLRRVDGELRIARRVILLDQNVILSKNLSVFF